MEDAAGSPLGISTLTSLDFANRKAEYSVGFGTRPIRSELVYALILVLDFAFFRIHLNKVTAHVYSENEFAVKSAERAGFHREGFLVDHFFLPPGEFASVHVFGMTKQQLLSNQLLVQIATRRMGLMWTAAR